MEKSWNFVSPNKWEPCKYFGMLDEAEVYRKGNTQGGIIACWWSRGQC